MPCHEIRKSLQLARGLDDLISVVQGTTHNRSFAYDSLKRLTSSTNPETGTTAYTYDADNNVITKSDARGFTIAYSYEQLNRMTGRTYSNGDPSVSYAYDQTTCVVVPTCYNIGRRTSMTDADGSESTGPTTQWAVEWGEQRTTNSITKTTGYTYDLNGESRHPHLSQRARHHIRDGLGGTPNFGTRRGQQYFLYSRNLHQRDFKPWGLLLAAGGDKQCQRGPYGWLDLASSQHFLHQSTSAQPHAVLQPGR